MQIYLINPFSKLSLSGLKKLQSYHIQLMCIKTILARQVNAPYVQSKIDLVDNAAADSCNV